jgi:phosphate starvation-inducible protein PhoH
MHQTRVIKQSYPKKKKAVSKIKQEIEFLQKGLSNNGKAIDEGPRKKKWSVHDLRSIKPLTPAQEDLFKAFFAGNHICAYGSAGTGKSYCALWLALNEIVREDCKQNRIIIVRSIVPTRAIGFLPGTEEEKMEVYERPYVDIVGDILGKTNAYEDLKKAGYIEFVTTSFIRGCTWNDAIVILDEGENCNIHEINSIMGRIGKNTRVMVLGDSAQTDLLTRKDDIDGLPTFLKIIERMPESEKIKFLQNDIIRSKFCKSWICAYEQYLEELVK